MVLISTRARAKTSPPKTGFLEHAGFVILGTEWSDMVSNQADTLPHRSFWTERSWLGTVSLDRRRDVRPSADSILDSRRNQPRHRTASGLGRSLRLAGDLLPCFRLQRDLRHSFRPR